MLRVGTQKLSELRVGTQKIKEAWVGATKVFSSEAPWIDIVKDGVRLIDYQSGLYARIMENALEDGKTTLCLNSSGTAEARIGFKMSDLYALGLNQSGTYEIEIEYKKVNIEYPAYYAQSSINSIIGKNPYMFGLASNFTTVNITYSNNNESAALLTCTGRPLFVANMKIRNA